MDTIHAQYFDLDFGGGFAANVDLVLFNPINVLQSRLVIKGAANKTQLKEWYSTSSPQRADIAGLRQAHLALYNHLLRLSPTALPTT